MINVVSHLEEMIAYHDEAHILPDDEWAPFQWVTFEDAFEQTLEAMRDGPQRWEVLNREERQPISSLKRALIHERDGNACVYCGEGGHVLTVDHIIPRSAFPAQHIDIADRSDNLVSACWPCNKRKSNFHRDRRKRPGVTRMCWECENPSPDQESEQEAAEAWSNLASHSRRHLVYCGRCGMGGTVPHLGWVL